MTIIHSSDLGWKANQDISKEFATLAKTFKPGDTFVFDHMYKISGRDIDLPNNFTLAGGTPGAGINIIDSATNTHALMELGNANTLIDLTVTHSNTPNNDYVNKISIAANGKDDIKVLNSKFEGNVGILLEIRDVDNLVVKDSEFDGGYYQMRVTSGENMLVENTLFQNSFGDGIKTSRAANKFDPVTNATVVDSVFLNNGRDGIDTTGGFRDSIVKDSVFVGNSVSAMDIKTAYDEEADFSGPVKNVNILITGSEFIDNHTAVIVTTNDLGDRDYLNPVNALKYASQDITLENSIVENTASTNKKMLYVKDSYDVHWNNVTLLGRINELRVDDRYDLGLPNDISGTNVTTGSPRPSVNDSVYRDMAGPDWSSVSYPTNGNPTPPPVDTTPTPDPISFVPDPPVDPVVDNSEPEVVFVPPAADPGSVVVAPTPDADSVSIPSKLLNVYLAYTKTNKNVAELSDGATVDNELTAGKALTIYATSQNGAPAIGSVRLEVPGFGTRMENADPYALFGDNGKGNLFGNKEMAEGTYSVTMTAFGGKNGTGETLETVTFDFTVDGSASTPDITTPDPVDTTPVVVIPPETDLAPDASPVEQASQLIDIKLINADSDKVVAELHQGAKLSSDDIIDQKLTISAEAIDLSGAGIGSMRLELDGQYSRIENVAPFALFGDNGKGNFFGGKTLDDGAHFATLTAYSGKNCKGSVLEKVTVQFEVGDYDSVMVGGKASNISSYSSKQDTGTATVSNDPDFIRLDDSAWKSLSLFKEITEMTVMKVDFKSGTEGEIHGIGFSNGHNNLAKKFFQLDGSQELGIQDYNGTYKTGSGFDTYFIPVGQHFTGEFDKLVLVNDDDAGVGAFSVFDNISFFEAVA